MEARKINKSIKDIEALLKLSIKERNLALTELNLIRLLKLMNYLIKKLELTENYNTLLKNQMGVLQMEVDVWEKEFLTDSAKKGNCYHIVKARIDETFK
jgi:hypothetical protein